MSFKTYKLFLIFLIQIIIIGHPYRCSVVQEKLIKNLFKSYNKLIRPVKNSSDHVVITMDLVLLQLINVYEKEQIMKTNVWINLKWTDFQLNWTTNDYKVGSFRVPYDRVWTPDIVLFNNADGNYEASYKPNVVVYADFTELNILWIPPAIYKSSCTIDVKYFPFDEQQCEMRFGSWTFDAMQVRLKQDKPMVNLEDYLPSGTWDVIEVPVKEVDFAEANRMELVYTFKIRRKTLFYTVNLIIPTVLISFLSIFVFYLPTDEGEKMTLCISILLALVVFLLLVSKILPPTSMVIPLISKYLIFTLLMNIVTILNTVIIINMNYRTPRTHNMPQWVRVFIIGYLPKLLLMKRPKPKRDAELNEKENKKYSKKKSNLEYDCSGGGFSSSLIKDSCSTKDDISIPIIKSNSINFNNQNNTASLNRPKQQQHKNLDLVAANLNAHSKRNEISQNAKNRNNNRRVGLFQDERFDSEEDYRTKKTQSIEINTVDSVISVNHENRNQTLVTSIVNNSKGISSNKKKNVYNNPPENYSTMDSSNLQRRTNFAERRRQFSQSNSQSRSFEAELNESDPNDERNASSCKQIEFSPEIMEAADKVTYITNHIKSENYYEEMREDWKYVALVIDRLLLIIFFSVTVIGTALILFNAPHIFQFVDQQEILNKLIKANHF